MVQELRLKQEGKTIIGLTGTFGSGKSTVAECFREFGAFVVDADKLAHEALCEQSPVFGSLREMFETAYDEKERRLDRGRLAKIVFCDAQARNRLESIIHPYVYSRVEEEVGKTAEKTVVIEVPLLFETGYEKFCDHVIVVQAKDEIIDERLSRKGLVSEDIRARRAAQMPMDEKIKRADVIIDNSGAVQQTKREVEKTWKKFHPESKGAI